MAKYSKKAQEKIGTVMDEFKEGTLKSSSGDKVTNRKQAIAIGISEAKSEGYKAPDKPAAKKSSKAAPAKKSASKAAGSTTKKAATPKK